MKYLKFFKKEKNPFNQEEIDEVEDILLTYIEDDKITQNGRHRFNRVNNTNEIKEGMINSYYISTENPYHNPNKKLNRIMINIYGPQVKELIDTMLKFKNRILLIGYKISISNKPHSFSIKYGGYYGKDNKYMESYFSIGEYQIYITK